jgi:protein-L-isoaspartate(D-aspartate) O-methyltransferase
MAPAAPRVAPQLLRPQRTVHEAAAPRGGTPGGLGLDSAVVRARMVQRLRSQGVTCEPVLAAMGKVPRHLFVDTALATQAYEDTSLPIGQGQTISKPSVVARMLSLLFASAAARDRGDGRLGRVLEIGTGCGYQAALLATLAQRVISVERLAALHARARQNLDAIGVPGVRLVYGDGTLGHGPGAPFDAIIAAAGGDALPAAWLEQLGIGARLVAPMHDAAAAGQVLIVVERNAEGFTRTIHDAVHFVPLKSGLV